MATTYATFLAELAGLTITGVERMYDYPPASLNTADLPAAWVQLPRGDEQVMTFQAGGGWPAMTADLIVATEPAAQSMQSSNHDAMVAMMDAVSTALRAAKFAKGTHSWSIKSARITVAGIDYWGVVVTVVGHG